MTAAPNRGVNPAPGGHRVWIETLVSWALPLLVVALWEVAADTGLIAARVLPAPSSVAIAGWRMMQDGSLPQAVAVSALRAVKGLVIGGALGFILGVANGLWRPAELTLDGTLQMLRNVPHLAIIPLVILWFGIGEEAKVFLVALGVLFPVYLNTYHGVRTIDPGLLEMARVHGLGFAQLFWRVVLPGALPSIFIGLRYGLGLMWLTLIVAETISASSGIGYMTMNAREFLQTDVVLLGVIAYALLGKLSDSAAKFCERATLFWHPSYMREARQ
ncbi:MAG: ABC transporter permease subunit [Bradyrhizobium sp.]|nr:MAG: ABC transporter permease subunit [Bradyrhizobium sp.]